MFTGIIEEKGTILAVEYSADAARLTVRGPIAVAGAAHGDSISVGGVCLTVVAQTPDSFTADVMAQTLNMSTIGGLKAGDEVNLERAALVGDRLGGHIVQGHIDGTGTVLEIRPGDAWRIIRFSIPEALARLVVDKGSIAVSGVSLTVSTVGRTAAADGGAAATEWFEVSLIPETLTATTLGTLQPGDRVNLETDILARHVERLLAFQQAASTGEPPTVLPSTIDSIGSAS
jgi:riboflavin synthase